MELIFLLTFNEELNAFCGINFHYVLRHRGKRIGRRGIEFLKWIIDNRIVIWINRRQFFLINKNRCGNRIIRQGRFRNIIVRVDSYSDIILTFVPGCYDGYRII